MSIWDVDKLVLFVAFVIPGFIGLKAYELLNPGSYRESSKQLIDAIAYSCINYAILFWPILVVESSDLREGFSTAYYAFYFFVVFCSPVLGAILWLQIRKTQFMLRALAHPTLKPWDYVFSKRDPYWAKVTLKDGTEIAGKYSENSFASSSPAEEQIYLEETWIISEKGGLERMKNQSAGVIIVAEIAYIELMEYYPPEEQS